MEKVQNIGARKSTILVRQQINERREVRSKKWNRYRKYTKKENEGYYRYGKKARLDRSSLVRMKRRNK